VTYVRVAAAAAAALLGLAALGLAHDLRAWDKALRRGDAVFAEQAAGARWRASTWLPGDPAVDVLGLAGDLALRRAEQAFVVARKASGGFAARRGAQRRAEAELALSEVVASGSPAAAARAGNLLGILAATADDADGAAASEARAAETFDAAIRADPSNTDAKYNLELLLRRIRVVGSREGAGGSAGFLGDALSGAGSGKPGSGY